MSELSIKCYRGLLLNRNMLQLKDNTILNISFFDNTNVYPGNNYFVQVICDVRLLAIDAIVDDGFA